MSVNLSKNKKFKICIIGGAHPSRNPRLVREVDSLLDVGYDVRVILPLFDDKVSFNDDELLSSRKWRLDVFDYRPSSRKWFSFYVRGRSKFMRLINRFFKSDFTARLGYIPFLPEMTALAASEYADLYIAHTQRALPIAVNAAQKWSSHVGFDCEDLLAELDAGDDPHIVRKLESQYIPLSDYLSSPSNVILNQLISDYKFNGKALVLYNVFPQSLAESMKPPIERINNQILKLHWFSTTIGPNRGIETIVQSLQYLDSDVSFSLRGNISEDYRSHLEKLGTNIGKRNALSFLPVIHHDDLIRSMDDFDIGFASEMPQRFGYAKTVSNKLFSYMLAGLAIAASDTPGQKEIMDQVPQVGFVYKSDSPRDLADKLKRLQNRNELLQAKQASWEAARNYYSWDIEQQKFLDVIDRFNQYKLTGLDVV